MNGATATPAEAPLYVRMRQLRRDARVSADAVAAALQMPASSLRARERGERGWTNDLVRRYADAVAACAKERRESAVATARDLKREVPRARRKVLTA